MRHTLLYILALLCVGVSAQNKSSADVNETVSRYVDPRIGSEGLGRVFIGPSCPYGMVKPGPDCTEKPNSGWLPIPEQVNGFAQTHVSGTGGGPKYGNILVQPFVGKLTGTSHPAHRIEETIELGYYSTVFEENNIKVEITTGERTSFYRFSYPVTSEKNLLIDAGFFLGEQPTPDAREAQQFVGSEIQILSDTEIAGYSRIRGGWNNGKAYTVYFYAIADRPFAETKTWKGKAETTATSQYDSHEKTGAMVTFSAANNTTDTIQLKVGISFISSLKAKANAQQEIPHWNFGRVHQKLIDRWENILGRVTIGETPAKGFFEEEQLKRMFYTGLYHTMLMPVDRKGESPGWSDDDSYYDDFYAIWDTYRTSSPLITLLDPDREVEIVNALLNIYKRDGYLPDARSGNSNGRTQGGSNAEIVIADAFVKGLKSIDYELAIEAMLKDATIPPGGNEEAEGRGGLIPYNELGYIPFGIPRAGNRTVEYAFCDYAIAVVADGLGKKEIAEKYYRQADNWKNLWRADYEQDGVRGFILPKDKNGRWLDHVPFGHSRLSPQSFVYSPEIKYEGPWYCAWWDCFMYEASSWEYSLSIPHDVPSLIEACGGAVAFEKRLDTFFAHDYYNVANEPSFLTPCLYHWIGKPEKTSERVLNIIKEKYNDSPSGIPGNDDSGAMSSWLAFHILGLYPNAGHNYYLLHTPLVKEATFNLTNGKTFKISAPRLNEKNTLVKSVKLVTTIDGKTKETLLEDFRITHQQILDGGELVFEMVKNVSPNSLKTTPRHVSNNFPTRFKHLPDSIFGKKLDILFLLHGQKRNFNVTYEWRGAGTSNSDRDTLVLHWGIQRNLDYWTGTYTMTPEAIEDAESLCYEQPLWGNHLVLDKQTFCILPRRAFREIAMTGECRFNNTTWKVCQKSLGDVSDLDIHLIDINEGAEMWVMADEYLPIITKMVNNPVEINWEMKVRTLAPTPTSIF